MKNIENLGNARGWLPLFVVSAGALASVRLLEWRATITIGQGTYVETAIWIGIYLVVLNEFRKVDFRSRYFRNVFVVFSLGFLAQLLLDLPIVAEILSRQSFAIFKYLDIIINAMWSVSCGLLLHALLASVHLVERESQTYEAALRTAEESEARLRAMFDAAADALFVKDENRCYTHANRRMSELFRQPLKNLFGAKAEQFFDAEQASEIEAEDSRVLAGETLDLQVERTIGGRSASMHSIKVPMRGPNNKVVGIFGISRDITDRKQAEADLQLAQFALDKAVDAVLWIREDGSIVYANDVAKHHMRRDRRPADQHVWEIDLRFTSVTWRTFWIATERSLSETYETEFSGCDDQPVPMEVRAYRFRHDDADLLCMISRDITERKRLQSEVQQRLSELSHLSRMQIANEMVAGIAHELNQPLAAIANYSFIIATALSSNDSVIWRDRDERHLVAEKAQVISDESLRAGEIIRRLRAFVNRREFKQTRIDLNRLVKDTLRIFESQWIGTENPVVTDLCDQQLWAFVDEIQIQQIILNLLNNAKDAVKGTPNAKIRIETMQPQDSCYVVAVTDNGTGLSDFGTEKLFQPFVSSKEHGMGLGLSISRSIARVHGGDLTAHINDGVGAVFHLTLPAHACATEAQFNEAEGIRR